MFSNRRAGIVFLYTIVIQQCHIYRKGIFEKHSYQFILHRSKTRKAVEYYHAVFDRIRTGHKSTYRIKRILHRSIFIFNVLFKSVV